MFPAKCATLKSRYVVVKAVISTKTRLYPESDFDDEDGAALKAMAKDVDSLHRRQQLQQLKLQESLLQSSEQKDQSMQKFAYSYDNYIPPSQQRRGSLWATACFHLSMLLSDLARPPHHRRQPHLSTSALFSRKMSPAASPSRNISWE